MLLMLKRLPQDLSMSATTRILVTQRFLHNSNAYFKLLHFKSEFKNHNIEVIVDNATTHTAKPYSLSDFGKSIGTRCTTDTIEYMDSQGQLQVIDCFFKRGPNNGLSKGLLEISKELNVKLPPKVKLEQLKRNFSEPSCI